MARAARGPRTLARYGLPDTPAIRSDLAAVGLRIDGEGPRGVSLGSEAGEDARTGTRPGTGTDPVTGTGSDEGLDPRVEADSDPVLAALSRAGRPELALRQLARLAAAQSGDEMLLALHEDPGFRGRLLGLLGGSEPLGDHLVAHPADWVEIADDAPFPELTSPLRCIQALDAAAHRADSTILPVREAITPVRAAYRTRLAVIAAADLAPAVEPGAAGPDLSAVCDALTVLADALLDCALDLARAAHPGPAPVRLAVVAMGKCGAQELNYLSDVDVIFVAGPGDPEAPSPAGPSPSEPDPTMLVTATAQATDMMRICHQVAWEVDAGLRPEGRAGPLVRTLAGHAAYYQRWAKTWEFQALLKARAAAGDRDLAQQFVTLTQAGVWSAADRDSFVPDVQAMRRRVADAVPLADRDRDLKLGAGSLRDVEFAVQLLQLVHGRVDETLRVPGTLAALAALTTGGYVGRQDGAELAEAYRFLRHIEHRVQLQHLRRTHHLPANAVDREWLARASGVVALAGGTRDATGALDAELARHAGAVRRLHEKLFYRPLLAAVAAVPTDELRLTPKAAETRLAALGFVAAQPALRHIAALTDGLSRRAAIQRTLLPVLLDTFADAPDPDGGLLAYRQVSDALADTPWYLRLLRDEGLVAQRLARLLGTSRLVADLLQRAPEVLRLLVHDADLIGPDAAGASAVAAAALLARADRAGDTAAAADSARSARRHEMLRLACADLLGVADLGTVSAGLSSVADAVVQAAVLAAQRQIAAERGAGSAATGGADARPDGDEKPSGDGDSGRRCTPGGHPAGLAGTLAVIAMGRFGGAEMGYSSDADVLFVAGPARPGADPGQVLTDAAAIAELATRLLGRPSPDPPLRIDADLRPEGRGGPLVRTVASYQQYWLHHAQPWERQALLRARAVAGDEALATEFLAAAESVRYPAGGLPAADVREVRRIKARVDAERLPRGADPTLHTKLGRGGLTDVEWTVQLLQLRHAGAVPEIRRPGTIPAIRAAERAGLLASQDADALVDGWVAATRARNAIMLVTGRPGDEIPAHGRVLAGIARACGYSADTDPGTFVDDYRRATRHARRVVDRLFDRD